MVLADRVLASSVVVPQLGELVIGLICFLVLLGLLYRTAYPQIRKTYEERTDKIEGGLKRAEQAQQEAKETLERYRAQLKEARNEANEIKNEAREEGKRIQEELRKEGEQTAERIKAQGEEQIRTQRDRAAADLRTEVGTLAVSLAERIIGRELESEERHRQLVEDFIAQLESETGKGGSGKEQERASSGSSSRDS